jgi:hypothetical protein
MERQDLFNDRLTGLRDLLAQMAIVTISLVS